MFAPSLSRLWSTLLLSRVYFKGCGIDSDVSHKRGFCGHIQARNDFASMPPARQSTKHIGRSLERIIFLHYVV